MTMTTPDGPFWPGTRTPKTYSNGFVLGFAGIPHGFVAGGVATPKQIPQPPRVVKLADHYAKAAK